MSLRFQYGTSWSARATASEPISRPSAPLQQELEVEAPACAQPPVLAAVEAIDLVDHLEVSDDGVTWSRLATDCNQSRSLQTRPVWQPKSEPQLLARAVRPPVQASASQRYGL
jgi:hypothetical protein